MARERQLEAYRAMTPEHRLHLADEMTTAVRTLAGSGAGARADADSAHPHVIAEIVQVRPLAPHG